MPEPIGDREDMDRDSVERLRFDRRLQRRAGWVEPSEREAHLETLPDVSDKMTTCADEENPSGATPATPGSTNPPPAFGAGSHEGGSSTTF